MQNKQTSKNSVFTMSKQPRLLAGLSSLLITSVLVGTLTLSGCSASGDAKILTVNGTPVNKSEYDKTYDQLSKAFYASGAPENQKNKIAPVLRDETLKRLILKTLIHNTAAKMNIKVTDVDVQDYKKEHILKDKAMADKFKAFLEQNKTSEADFDEILKDIILVNKVIAVKAGSEIVVTDAEVKTAYERNKQQFNIPETVHAYHILIEAIVPKIKKDIRDKNPQITDAELNKQVAEVQKTAKEKAEKDYEDVKAHPDRFEAIAKLDSNDTASAKNGGDVGFMMKGSTDPSFWSAIEKTPDGQLYPGVVTSQFGYHVVKVVEHKKPQVKTFDDVKEGVKQQLTEIKRQGFIQKWLEQERATAKIKLEPAFEKDMKHQAEIEQKEAQQEAKTGAVAPGTAQ
jgi:parvulin-like peptidyl-prolyl isomerase